MADYDLVIRNGEIHDGIGGAPIIGDVAVNDGLIVAVGRVDGTGAEEIDATGRIVTPGFVDVHTHFDAQCTWENTLAPSSGHGVTTAVMGNCGVGFAPCKPDQRDILVKLMEGIEDIPEVVMAEGLPWNWQTFPEYLDSVASRELDIDVAAQLPHSALRLYVMGDRAVSKEPATAEDLAQMRALVTEAVEAGAIGVSTSRMFMHRTRAGDPAPTLYSNEDEFVELAKGLNDAGRGVFQMIPGVDKDPTDEFRLIRRIAEAAQRPVSFSLVPTGPKTADWLGLLDRLTEAQAEGLAVRAQIAPRPFGVLYGLDLSFHPFSLHPSYQPIADLPLADKVKALRDPELRARLLSEQPEHPNSVYLNFVSRGPLTYMLGSPPNYEPDISERADHRAAALGISVDEYIYDRLLEDDGHAILYFAAGYENASMANIGRLVHHPHTLISLADGGAHYGMICDSSFPTWFLYRWSRDALPEDRVPLPQAIAELTSKTAEAMGFLDRGRIAPGYKADINVIDLDRLGLHAPTVERDLPANGKRLHQRAEGYDATIKAGRITYRHGKATGALPGRLVRGGQPAPVAA